MTSHLLNTIGLAANMLGVVLAFFFGFPQPDHDEGVGLGLMPSTRLQDGRTVAQYAEDTRRRKRLFRRMSLLALALMFAGFSVQAVAVWVC
jgi:hypothetical protein